MFCSSAKSLISYQGNSIQSLEEDFKRAIDEYLDMCEAKGIIPDKAYKGTVTIKFGTDAKTALAQGKTLNAFIKETLIQRISQQQ